MRARAAICSLSTAALLALGIPAPAVAASPYDTVTVSSMRNLVTAMESYAMFDGGDQYEDVTESILADWGWVPSSNTHVDIWIEGDGEAWRAAGQDTRSGAQEYTYTSSTAVNGANPGSVTVSAPQPMAPATTAGVTIHDVGTDIDIDALSLALVTAGVTIPEVCEMSLAAPVRAPPSGTRRCGITPWRVTPRHLPPQRACVQSLLRC